VRIYPQGDQAPEYLGFWSVDPSVDQRDSEQGWRADEKGQLYGNRNSGTLTAAIPTQGKAVEIEIEATGSRGRVLVESDGFSELAVLDSPIGLTLCTDRYRPFVLDRYALQKVTMTKRVRHSRTLC
jgi:hypothetical protein